ncbi:MAG: hypothetical protein JNK04_25200, partial [Myxococcales bacterium]|nr:hypothetical protein [Myxococcales bacterium]
MLLWRLSALVLCSSMLGCGGENCPPDAEPDCVDNRDCEEVYRDMYDQLRELYYGC